MIQSRCGNFLKFRSSGAAKPAKIENFARPLHDYQGIDIHDNYEDQDFDQNYQI